MSQPRMLCNPRSLSLRHMPVGICTLQSAWMESRSAAFMEQFWSKEGVDSSDLRIWQLLHSTEAEQRRTMLNLVGYKFKTWTAGRSDDKNIAVVLITFVLTIRLTSFLSTPVNLLTPKWWRARSISAQFEL